MDGQSPPTSKPVHGACPRCAYDLDGLIAAWPEGVAPARGTCSECGLEFAWQDLLDPRRQRCAGLFEHARTMREHVAWFARTLLWMVWPGVYWSRVQMHHETRTMSLAVRLGLLSLGLHLVAGGVHALGCMFSSAWWVPQLGWMQPSGAVYAHVLLQPIAGVDIQATWGAGGLVRVGLSEWIGETVALACMLGMWPLMFLALPVTRSLAKVHWGHIGRAALTPLMWVVVLLAVRAVWIVLCVAYAGVYVASAKRWPAWHASLPDPNMSVSFESVVETFSGTLRWAMAALMAWLLVWWGFAIVRGWRVGRGWVVYALLALAAILATMGLGVWAGLLVGRM